MTDASHGAVTNDFVTFTGATTFAGIPASDLNKEHQITVVDGGSYTITVATTANATTTGGGTPSAAYQINTGLDTIVGTGWGAGLWGGTTAADPATTLVVLLLRTPLARVALEPVWFSQMLVLFHLRINCC